MCCKKYFGEFCLSSKFQRELRKLYNYNYPGNIRELRNIISRATILSQGHGIEKNHLVLTPVKIKEVESSSFVQEALNEANETREALVACGWNRRQAANRLGISYEALRWRIKKHQLKSL